MRNRFRRSRPAPGRRTRAGQVMIEFTFVFMTFLVVFFAIIEFARVMNILVTVNTVVQASATFSAQEDPTLSIKASDVETKINDELAQYGYLNPANLTTINVDVNHVGNSGALHSRVSVTYTVPPLFIPTNAFFTTGGLPLTVTAMRTNETQELRQ